MTPAADLARLRADLRAAGWYRPATARVLAELLLGVTLTLVGLAAFAFHPSWPVRLCGLVLSTAGTMAVGTNAHTASHHASSDRRALNQALTFFGFTIWGGLSSTFWLHRHVAVHHRAPNVSGKDDDLDYMPYFAVTADDVAGSTGWRRTYYRRVQWFAFPLALAGNAFSFMANGWRHVVGKLRRPDQRRTEHWIDLAAMIAHLALWLGLPMLCFPPLAVIEVHLARMILLGYGMFAVLAPGHLPREAQYTRIGDEADDFLVQQTITTVNFQTGVVGRFICAGLEYQIEHHLFPGIPHVRYPALSPQVQALCGRHRLPYRSFRWEVALWKSWDVLRRPKEPALLASPRSPDPAWFAGDPITRPPASAPVLSG